MRKIHLLCFLFIALPFISCGHNDYLEDSVVMPESRIDSPFKGCKISIMGNSRCTYRGYIPSANRTYYPRYDINNVNLTWWWKVIKILDAKLEVNESFSAGRVSNRHPSFPSYIDRVGNLGNPDVIFFWGGINDQRNNTPLGNLDFTKTIDELDESSFAPAMDKLIRLMIKCYPNAEIIIFIEDELNDDGYINTLKEIAAHYGLKTIDLTGLTTTRCQGLHYDIHGMQQIVDETIRQIGL